MLIYLNTHNQYLFLIIYHEFNYHRITLMTLTVHINYIKFIFDSEFNCCLLSVKENQKYVIMNLIYDQV